MFQISVIVPVFKVENVLHYCIDSILNQTFNDFELILIDDGSPDNSGKICDEYAKIDSRVKVVHKENEGVSVARNAGLELAKGKYICFVDSDDYIQRDYLEKLILAKKSNTDCQNIWCKFLTVNDYKHNLDMEHIYCKEHKYSIKDIMTLHEKWLDAGPVCKLYDKDIITNNNIRFNQNLSLGEDLTFNFEYLDYTSGDIVVIDCELYNYVNTNINSLSNKYYENMFDIYKQLNSMMYRHMKKWNCDEIQFDKYYSACFYKYEVVMKNTFHTDSKLSKKEKYKYNRKILKSDEFKQSLNLSTCFIHPLYKLAYKSKNYKFVQLVDKIVSLRNR